MGTTPWGVGPNLPSLPRGSPWVALLFLPNIKISSLTRQIIFLSHQTYQHSLGGGPQVILGKNTIPTINMCRKVSNHEKRAITCPMDPTLTSRATPLAMTYAPHKRCCQLVGLLGYFRRQIIGYTCHFRVCLRGL